MKTLQTAQKTCLGNLEVQTGILLLGIGLACAGISMFEK